MNTQRNMLLLLLVVVVVALFVLLDTSEAKKCRKPKCHRKESSSSSEECQKKKKRCPRCPFGWTAGKVGNKTHCYKAVSLNGTGQLNAAQWDTVCAQFNATAVSIESAAENNLTYQLSVKNQPNIGTIYIGIRLARTSPAVYGPITGITWTDGTVVTAGGYGYATGAVSNAGVAPWASSGFPPQPDNRPATAGCALMWGNIVSCAGSPGCNGTPLQPGRWDDVTCTSVFPGTVCEFVPPKKTKKPKKSSESDED